MSSSEQDLQQQVEQLETKLAFQEDSIEQLNQALVTQQKQLLDLEYKLSHVMSKVKELSVSNLAAEDQEAPPPHY